MSASSSSADVIQHELHTFRFVNQENGVSQCVTWVHGMLDKNIIRHEKEEFEHAIALSTNDEKNELDARLNAAICLRMFTEVPIDRKTVIKHFESRHPIAWLGIEEKFEPDLKVFRHMHAMKRGERAAALTDAMGMLRAAYAVFVKPPQYLIARGPKGLAETCLASRLKHYVASDNVRHRINFFSLQMFLVSFGGRVTLPKHVLEMISRHVVPIPEMTNCGAFGEWEDFSQECCAKMIVDLANVPDCEVEGDINGLPCGSGGDLVNLIWPHPVRRFQSDWVPEPINCVLDLGNLVDICEYCATQCFSTDQNLTGRRIKLLCLFAGVLTLIIREYCGCSVIFSFICNARFFLENSGRMYPMEGKTFIESTQFIYDEIMEKYKLPDIEVGFGDQ